nr:hypothetical protein [Bacteroidota bacterium]
MYLSQHHTPSVTVYGKLILLTLLIFILSFPKLEPTYDTGIDPPLFWAYNYFFAGDVQMGRDIVFTFGPLGFLKSPVPLANNLLWAIGIWSALRIAFIFLFLLLARIVDPAKWAFSALLALVLCHLFYLDLFVLGITGFSLVLSHITHRRGWIYLACTMVIFGLLVKSSIGIIALLMLIPFLILHYINFREYRTSLAALSILIFGFIGAWLLIYGNFTGIGRYLYGTVQLAGDNSAAVSLYPYNNWWLLSGSILTFLLLPFLIREKRAFFLYLLFGLSIFAAWKHGMSREDYGHARGFFLHLVLFLSILLITTSHLRKVHFGLAAFVLIFFYANMKNAINYRDFKITVFGINALTEVLFDYDHLVEKSNRESQLNIAVDKLSDSALMLIGKKTVDFYPWNFVFAPANDLNWQPRPVLQSYASYTPWIDAQNAKHFAGGKAPDFLVWELVGDRWGGNFGGIDNRYILNDEPQMLMNFFDRYALSYKDNDVLIYKKTDGNHLGKIQIIKEEAAAWREWIEVPKVSDGILRAKLRTDGNLLRTLKTQVYKDEAFYIEYKLDNGEVKKYRIVPLTAELGIWIHPLILDPQSSYIEPEVKYIRFSCSDHNLVKDKILLKWEYTGVINLPDTDTACPVSKEY